MKLRVAGVPAYARDTCHQFTLDGLLAEEIGERIEQIIGAIERSGSPTGADVGAIAGQGHVAGGTMVTGEVRIGRSELGGFRGEEQVG